MHPFLAVLGGIALGVAGSYLKIGRLVANSFIIACGVVLVATFFIN